MKVIFNMLNTFNQFSKQKIAKNIVLKTVEIVKAKNSDNNAFLCLR
jgi:hypothetical protein